MRGESLELKQFEGGQFGPSRRRTGAHDRLHGSGRRRRRFPRKRGSSITTRRTSIVEMTGGALLTRGTDKLDGHEHPLRRQRAARAGRRRRATAGSGS